MKRCQPVYVGVVNVSSLPQERCHLLPVPGGAGGHKHRSLGEADLWPPRPAAAAAGPAALVFRSVRLRAEPSPQLILPSLLGSFGPGMVSGRHLSWSDSVHGTRRSGLDGLGSRVPLLAAPPGGRPPEMNGELHSELLCFFYFISAAFKYYSENRQGVSHRPAFELHF